MAFILTEKRDSTGIITLNHAEKRNALSETLIEEITSALEGFRALEIRAVELDRDRKPGRHRRARGADHFEQEAGAVFQAAAVFVLALVHQG